ncbi:paraquat-inducible protein B [Geomonas limicola]|uniref:Paraquat-inducible protein B n=1 Tax=Geomonas limicola TaxID=2740186 RepID=A0A6V8N2E0_9BACT|nr:MlaD family protein [Geomonas limicola]GFO66682.1 paraquat-inducible protein B [Geomonas limicola]
MNETPTNPELPEIPEAVSEPRRRFSIQLVWIIPIVAALVGLSIAAKAILDRGETITIIFKTGEGMEAGKTKIKYKDVQIGEVKGLAISKDRSHVVVTAEMTKDARGLLVKDTRFYVVRARISGGSVTGLGTLIGGSYIGVDAGTSSERRDEFVGLDAPPAVSLEVPGRQFVLHADDVGSVDASAPVFFRRLQVGHVIGTELDPDGKGVTIRAFIRAPFDQYVKTNSVFWHASGVDVSLNASGIKVNTESLVSILLGGIAFQTPEDRFNAPPAQGNSVFALYGTKEEAFKHAEVAERYTLVFQESVRGLAVGAPVDLRGVTVGEVTRIDVALNANNSDVAIPVEIQLYPERLKAQGRDKNRQVAPLSSRQLIDSLVAHGFRAEIKSGSLVTGQLYVSLDFFPKAKVAHIDWSTNPPHFPTVPGSMGELQKQLMRIVQKFEKMPLEELGGDARKTVQSLDATLKSADRLLKNVDQSVVPEARSTLVEARKSLEDVRGTLDELKRTLGQARGTLGQANGVLAPDAPLQLDLRDTLREVSRAAQSLRVLGDYLEQHPESLVRGKQEDKK